MPQVAVRAYVGAYWGARLEPADVCAHRLARCLEALADADPALATWFSKSRRRATAHRPLDTTIPSLARLIDAGRNRDEIDRTVIPQLGSQVGIWNGQHHLAASLSTTCGGTTPRSLNSVVLSLPTLDTGSARLYELSTLRRVMLAFVDAWEPDWATCVTDALRDAQERLPRTPVIGLLTYLGPARRLDLPLPGGKVEAAGGGHLIVLGEQFEGVADVVAPLRRVLDVSGALAPTP